MENHESHGAPAGHDHAHGGSAEDTAALAEMLELDAEVLRTSIDEVTGLIAELAGVTPPLRVLDLGSGPGTGTFALLRRFAGATVTALDISAPMLHRLETKAAEQGLADRVRTVEADLDADWPGLEGPVDLVWASASLHHMKDPGRALARAFDALRPGGLLAVTEMGDTPFPRFLPEDLGFGRPGLEGRLHAALGGVHEEEVPHLGDDWGVRLRAAGFAVETERVLTFSSEPPVPAAVGRYAQLSLSRMREGFGDRLAPEDQAAMDRLVDTDDPLGVRRREDLSVWAERSVWLAVRP